MVTILFMLNSMIQSANAAKCSAYVTQGANQKGAELVRTFSKLAACDKDMANENFTGAFLPRATDFDTLVSLTETAINAKVWDATWKMLPAIKDYGVGNDIAAEMGKRCSDNPEILQFLQGGYFALKNNDFMQWDDAYVACENEKMTTWFNQQVTNPPSGAFNEKYNTLLDMLIKKDGVNSLPLMQEAALKAADDGPFDSILNHMNAAIQPELGSTMSDENRTAFENAVLNIAQEAPHKALELAQQLNAVQSTKSGELLKLIYADRLSDGLLTYGVAAIEAGECKGKKQAFIHYAKVTDPAKRMVILPDVIDTMKAVKAKSKCETEEWVVTPTSEPVIDGNVDAFLSELQSKYEGEGYKVKLIAEDTIALD